MPQPLLGPSEAARYLGISRATVHRLVKAGVLQPSKRTPAGFVRFSRETLDRYLDRSAQTPNDELKVLQDRLHQQRTQLDLARRLSGLHTEESIFMAVLAEIRNTLRCDQVSCWVPDPGQQTASCRAVVGLPAAVTSLPLSGSGSLARCIRTSELVIVEDVLKANLPETALQITDLANVRSYCLVPILGPRKVEGCLVVACRYPTIFSTGELDFLQDVASLMLGPFDAAFQRKRAETMQDTIEQITQLHAAGKSTGVITDTVARALYDLTQVRAVVIGHTVPQEGVVVWDALFPKDIGLNRLPAIPLPNGLAALPLEHDQGLYLDDVHCAPDAGKAMKVLLRQLDVTGWQVLPIRCTGQVSGLAGFACNPRRRPSPPGMRAAATVIRVLELILELRQTAPQQPARGRAV